MDEVVELGGLHSLAEGAGLGELVHERREPPREALGPPDAAQAACRVVVDAGIAVLAVVLDERPGEQADVAGGQVEALGSGRRNDVRRVAGQEEPAEAHRFDDEAAPVSYTHLTLPT